MKILFLTPWYPDELSQNSGLFIRSQALALSKTNEVMVISSKVNYNKFAICSYGISNVNSSSLQEVKLIISRSLPLYNQLNHLLITLLITRRFAKKFNPDIIHASIGYPGAIWGYAMSKFFGKPFVLTEHTRVKNNFRSFFHKRVTLLGLQKANALIAVSHSLAKELKMLLHREVQVIPNIIEVNKFKDVIPSPSTTPQFGFLGGMNTPVKGLDILLEAAAKIKSDFVLHIGGTGSLEQDYRSLAEKLAIGHKCKFYGFIRPDLLPEFMSRLHFFICSSRYETFCVSLIEAMACGLPVVSTKCGGPEDFVNDINGILCEKANPDALRNGLEYMMAEHSRYSQESLKTFAANFSPESFTSRIAQVYKFVLKN